MSKSKRKPLPAEPVEVMIESLTHEGRGLARVEGKAVFVDGALAGERVRFRYTRLLTSTVSISPHRTLVAATVGTTPSLMATDTAFYMSFRGDETLHHTFTPSSDFGITGVNDFMLWETTPFLTPPSYAVGYGLRSKCYLGLGGC